MEARIELRCGRWQDVLADVECDSLICDPPYSAKTDAGYMSHGNLHVAASKDIGYAPITNADAFEIAESWAKRTRRWAVIFGDHVSREWHAAAWREQGWYVFAPVIWVKRGAAPRFRGDGPASQVDHMMVAEHPSVGFDHDQIMVARPRSLKPDGSRGGWYMADTPRAGHGATGITGNKCPAAMREVVRDYSRPGDLIVDCFAGSGTTLRAARAEGRHAYGAEVDPVTYAKAIHLLDHGSLLVSADQERLAL